MNIFVVILTLLSTLMQLYLTWAVCRLGWVAGVTSQRTVWLGSLLLWLLFIAGVRAAFNPSGRLAVILERFTFDWLGILFLATSVLLLFDLLTGFGLWARPWLDTVRSGAWVVALLLIGVAFVQGTRAPEISHYSVTLPRLPATLDGTRIVMLSDLHLGSQFGPEWFANLVERVQALHPDLILLGGDIVEGHGPPDPALQAVFARLQAPLGVYAATGNHEDYGDTRAAIAMTEEAGVGWLHDEMKFIAPGLSLAGVDDLGARRGLDAALTGRIESVASTGGGEAVILLSHTPRAVEQAAAAGVGLMLSGHTHNGQIWPFNYLVKAFYPYITGRYAINGMTLIVGRGAGLWGPRMRLWRRGEIVEVTLRAK
jgi:predicted MPP superfamily phosphohydrolase